MALDPGSHVTLDIEKAVAGGRMLARHQGQIVLVSGAIPGERVEARIERRAKTIAYGETVEVLTPSPDRRDGTDGRCGGNVLGHVGYARQLTLKAAIIQDAFARIGRITLAELPEVVPSPERGYRMRARLHARDGRLGFYREGTHDLCNAAATGQLLPETSDWIARTERLLEEHALSGLAGIEIAENVPGSERAAHLDLLAGVDPSSFAALRGDLVGLSAQRMDRHEVVSLAGTASIADVLHVREGDRASALRLRRNVRGFFQGNRFLLERLVRHVVSLVPDGPVVDLYAGVGLFGLALAATGTASVTLVEGDPITGADLSGNAEPFRGRVHVERRSVEAFLAPRRTQRASASAEPGATFIVDPPRTGLSKEALRGIAEASPARIVYVSCDAPTLARDSRGLLDAGYALVSLTPFDLFPNTAHIETVALFGGRSG